MLKKRPHGWYPVSTLGFVLTILYAAVPPYYVYAQTTGLLAESIRMPLLFGMGFVLLCMVVCRQTNQKPFHKKR